MNEIKDIENIDLKKSVSEIEELRSCLKDLQEMNDIVNRIKMEKIL